MQRAAGGITMRAGKENSTPSASVLRRLVTPWERRHSQAAANVRFTAGGFQLGVGLVLLSLGRKAGTDRERRKCYAWSAWFLVNAALQFIGGLIDVTVARSAPPRTRS
jgi:hypothetical protein